MKILERKNFLQKLINSINTPDIKVITGIRRSGKSKLLEVFIEYLKRNIPNANIIHINYNLFQFSTLKNAAGLNEYVENLYSPEKENFLLIDEVPLCKHTYNNKKTKQMTKQILPIKNINIYKNAEICAIIFL